MTFRWVLVFLGLLVALTLTIYWEPQSLPAQATVDIRDALGGSHEGYHQVLGDIPIELPRDHGPHPDYKTEWWYFTGNLSSSSGRKFGYQLTFFRTAYRGSSKKANSEWSADDVFMAHLALSDIDRKKFHFFERFSRESLEMAGASQACVWLNDWQLDRKDDSFVLSAHRGEFGLQLTLEPGKPPILQGENGFSRKGSGLGVASYYYSLTRMPTTGKLTLAGEDLEVEGNSWMDHEWSSHTLADHLVGWDWFSLQFNDNTELMAFQLRTEDGRWDPYNAGCWVTAEGEATILSSEDFSLTATGEWKSPTSGVVYPSGWKLKVGDREIEVTPAQPAQELNVSVRYWEGAVTAKIAGSEIDGTGYVELVGYGRDAQRARRDSNPQPSGP